MTPSETGDLLAEGITHHRAGDLAAAGACYLRVLAAAPHEADALHLLGVVACQRGQPASALSLLRRAVELAPEIAPFHASLGRALLATGALGEAITSFEGALALDPVHAEARRQLGRAQRMAGSTADDWLRLAVAEIATGRVDAARAALERAVGRDPDRFRGSGRIAIGSSPPQAETRPELPQVQERVGIAEGAAVLEADLAPFEELISLVAETTMATAERALSMDPRSESDLLDWARAYGRTGELGKAAELYRVMLNVDPENPLAAHMLAAATGDNDLPRASDAYIEGLFNDFAGHFDKNLADLKYQAPLLAAERLAVVAPADRSRNILDLGCGTGLCGPLLRPFARRLVGVDLSAGMIALARKREVYDELVVAEITAYLATQEAAFDIVVSTDVLIYFGRIEGALAGIARALRAGGRAIFSVEHFPDGDVRLNPHGRYSHGEAYARAAVGAAGLAVVALDRVTLRTESGHPVEGLLLDVVRS